MADKLDLTPSPRQYKTMLLYIIHHSAIADDVQWAQEEYWRLFSSETGFDIIEWIETATAFELHYAMNEMQKELLLKEEE